MKLTPIYFIQHRNLMTNYKMDMFLVERNSLFIMKSIIGRIYFVEKQGGNALPRT
jgi:hypothetical protein